MNRWLGFLVLSWVWSIGCQSTSDDRSRAVRSGQLELARQFIDANQVTRAIAVLQPLVREEANDATAQYLYGLALVGLKDLKSAAFRFGLALEADPKLDDARLSLGYVLIASKKFAEAETELQKILEDGRYGFMERVHVNLGLNDLEQNKCKMALAHFDAAIQLDPTMVSAYFNRGKCLLRLRRLKQAEIAFQKASNFCPGCGSPQLELAKVMFMLGRHVDALLSLDRLMRETQDAEIKKEAFALKQKLNQRRR